MDKSTLEEKLSLKNIMHKFDKVEHETVRPDMSKISNL